MELNKQIKKYRTMMNLSQEDLAEHVYVTRQTISNWETGKSYPDIHSLLLLSSLFNVSLDTLIKGDLEMMREKVNEKEIREFNFYGSIFSVLLIGTVLSTAPLVYFLGTNGLIVVFILFAITMVFAFKVEGYKKRNDIQTYKEILAFTNGERLDEISKKQEEAKRPYQDILKVLISAALGFSVTLGLFKLLVMFF